jgi:uncharacterized protein (DUF58 family)
MPTQALFDTDFLQKLECLNLIARRLVFSRRQALRASVKKGASIEFKDFREYSPGDDPRSVDWMAYARLGELFIKLFRQEDELDLYLLLDCSGSMAFGEPSKFDHARRIAAALAYIGLANMDSAGIIPFADDLGGSLGPRATSAAERRATLERLRGKAQIFRTLHFLENLQPGSTTDFPRSIQKFISRVRRPGMIIILSDFYGLERCRPALDRLRFLKHQIHIFQLVSPWERNPPIRGELRLVDVESRSHQDLTITDSMLRRYKDAFAQFSSDLRTYSMKHAIGYEQAHTDQPFDLFLRKLLERGRLLA